MTEDRTRQLPTESKEDWVKRRKRMWTFNNPEKAREYSAKYRAANIDKVRAKDRERMAKRVASGEHAEYQRILRRSRAAGRAHLESLVEYSALKEALALAERGGANDHNN